jgi:hypothetical protein
MINLLAVLVAALLQGVVPPARSLDKGSTSDVAAARQVTIRDRDAWMALWRVHGSSRPLPDVDFSREMVVGVFLGSRPTAGFAVEIVGYREVGDAVVVQYRETAPAPDAITAQVIVSPYHLVAIPKRTGNVTFEKAGR